MAKHKGQTTSHSPRKVTDGKVASSDRTVWRISEEDIISVARKWRMLLTEEQLDKVSRYVDDHFSPNGEWFDVICMGLDNVGVPNGED